MRWCPTMVLGWSVLLGCAGESSDGDTAASLTATDAPTTAVATGDTSDTSDPTGEAASTTSTSADTHATSAESSSGPGVDGTDTTDRGDSSSDGGLDCAAPADCATCWTCASQGPCMEQYQSCQSMFNCVPSLVCVESMCTEDGLLQDCASNCCQSCVDLGTCGMVDPVISCIEQQCAGLCNDVTCP